MKLALDLDYAVSLIERLLEHVDCTCAVTVEAAKFVKNYALASSEGLPTDAVPSQGGRD